MKWKRKPCEFLSEKTFLIIKDNLDILKGAAKTTTDDGKTTAKNVANIGTWPPKMKRVPTLCEESERPKTANLERPSVLDPELVDKLDMSLLSKELLCSVTRFQQTKSSVGSVKSGRTTTSPSSSSSSSLLLLPPSPLTRPRQNLVIDTDERQRQRAVMMSRVDVPVRHQRRSFEQIHESQICRMEIHDARSSTGAQKSSFIKRNCDVKKLDDNNNRNGHPKVLSTVKKRSSRTGVPSDLEIFTTASTRSAPEPCKTCGRPDQPERFHSHPKGSQTKIKDIPTMATTNSKPKSVPVPKSVQKPVALNFRSDKSKSRPEEVETVRETKSKSVSFQDHPRDDDSQQTNRVSSAPVKRGPKTITCYICAREFGTVSFPIHEPKCMEKWERENDALPPSQRRAKPQKPEVGTTHNDWNSAAWKRSQEQLIPCTKCGRTFLPERLPIHERSCKAAPKNNEWKPEKLSAENKQSPMTNLRAGPLTVPCQICGRRFGTRSIKIHEPQCTKRWQMQNNTSNKNQSSSLYKQKSTTDGQEGAQSIYLDLSQKKTVTCYICGRDFGSNSIAIHEPQCLKKWQVMNDKLSPARRRKEPQKPMVVYTQDPQTGNMIVDQAATTEANWMSHLNQLVPCKHCGRTFNPDRVNVHERSCKGNR